MDDVQQPPNNPNMADPAVSGGQTVRLEPVTQSVIVPQPWYRRIFGPVMRTETVWKLSVVAMLVVGVLIGQQVQNPTKTEIQAATGKARVSIYPLETTIPPEKSFQLWMTTDQDVASADVTVTFDPSAIQLSKEVKAQDNPSFALTHTSYTQANQTGTLEFKITPKGTAVIEPGTKQFGSFNFTTKAGTSAVSATIMINEELTVVKGPDSVPFAITATNASVSLK